MTKSYIKGNYKASIFGMLLLVAGVGAGVVLVTQPQLLGQKAQVISNYTNIECADGVSCGDQNIPGSKACFYKENVNGTGSIKYCCSPGMDVINGACVKSPPNCPTNVVCDTRSVPLGSSLCYSVGVGMYANCCPGGSFIENGKCVDMRSNPLNCGRPGNVCTNGRICSNSKCINNPNVSCKGGKSGLPVCCTSVCAGSTLCKNGTKICLTNGSTCTISINSPTCVVNSPRF